MCGINGIFYFNQDVANERIIAKMNNAIAHRGPDNQGVFIQNKLGLGHVRLSIIDLSQSGNQPLHSNDGRYVLVFNGEIYNYKEIKSQICDYQFMTNSDSEVLLASYIKWGEQMLEHIEGMFAFAIFDKLQNSVFIARDILGIKPLYYYIDDNLLVFSSEIRGLISSGLFVAKLDKNKLSEFFRLGTITGEETLLENVKMFPSASFSFVSNKSFSIKSYWKPPTEINTEISYEQSKKDIRNIFLQSVEKRLVSDVPFGAFLSGGIDSTAITVAMSECVSGNVNTFNISFEENEFSEAYYANKVAQKFGTNHTEILLNPTLFLEEIDNIISAYDHPGFDGANTYIVSKVTRKAGISMALSGLGGDELFGGYPVFKKLNPTRQKLLIIPTPLLKSGSKLLNLSSKVRNKKLAELLSIKKPNLAQVYEIFRSVTSKEDCIKLTNDFYSVVKSSFFRKDSDLYNNISLAEFYYYMQPVLLRDADQMSMKHALEVRVPFLDRKLVEYVLALPDDYKSKTNVQKSLLVESLQDLLPTEIIHRKKMGFVLPWSNWLKNELSTYVQNAINSIDDTELLNATEWQSAFDDFKKGKNNYNWNIFWGLVVLVNWLKRNDINM